MARGDTVRVLVDVGTEVREFVTRATRKGRTVDVDVRKGMVEVSEMAGRGRNREAVLTNRFMQSRVVALIEEKVDAEPETFEDSTVAMMDREPGKPGATVWDGESGETLEPAGERTDDEVYRNEDARFETPEDLGHDVGEVDTPEEDA